MAQHHIEYYQHLKNAHDECVSSMLGNVRSESPVLYHYTSLQSALSILQNRTLRFTNILYLNDPSELQLGLEIGERVIPLLMEEYVRAGKSLCADLLGMLLFRLSISFASYSQREIKKPVLKAQLSPWLTDAARRMLDVLGNEEWFLYITCFSERDDDLRQWLPYGDNAQGAAIGFTPVKDNFHFLTESERNNIFIVSVCYEDNAKKEEYLSQFLRKALAIYEQYAAVHYNPAYQGDPNNDPGLLFLRVMTELLVTDLVACKSPHYKDEEEWRLFFIQTVQALRQGADPHPSFHIKNNLIKPYHDVKLMPNAIVDIRLGALCPDGLNADALIMLGHKQGFQRVIVTKSKIEYRG
jgi:hypothetical protein